MFMLHMTYDIYRKGVRTTIHIGVRGTPSYTVSNVNLQHKLAGCNYTFPVRIRNQCYAHTNTKFNVKFVRAMDTSGCVTQLNAYAERGTNQLFYDMHLSVKYVCIQ